MKMNLRIKMSCMSSYLPLGFSSTRRKATVFSSPTTKATSPDSSEVTIFRTSRCILPWLLIWLRSLFWRRLSASHHSPLVTPTCDSSTSKTASWPVVTVTSLSSRTMRTCSGCEREVRSQIWAGPLKSITMKSYQQNFADKFVKFASCKSLISEEWMVGIC